MTARTFATKTDGPGNTLYAADWNALTAAITALSPINAQGTIVQGGDATGTEQALAIGATGALIYAASTGLLAWSAVADLIWDATNKRLGVAGGVVASEQFACLTGDFTLSAASGPQTVLPAANDVLTVVAATTYQFEAFYHVTTGTTTHTTATAFATGGGASLTSVQYLAQIWTGAAATILTTAPSVLVVTSNASTVLNATNTNATTYILLRGIIRVNAGGTITPQIDFSANPTGTNLTKTNSYIRLWPVGSNTVASQGPWA